MKKRNSNFIVKRRVALSASDGIRRNDNLSLRIELSASLKVKTCVPVGEATRCRPARQGGDK